MTQWPFPVIDCDGHLVESIPELTEFMDSNMRQAVLNAGRQREGAFPSLDGFHGPRIRGAGAAKGEVDLEAAKEMIRDTVESKVFSAAEKAAVLGSNAQRFFKLAPKENQRAKAGPMSQAEHA